MTRSARTRRSAQGKNHGAVLRVTPVFSANRVGQYPAVFPCCHARVRKSVSSCNVPVESSVGCLPEAADMPYARGLDAGVQIRETISKAPTHVTNVPSDSARSAANMQATKWLARRIFPCFPSCLVKSSCRHGAGGSYKEKPESCSRGKRGKNQFGGAQ